MLKNISKTPVVLKKSFKLLFVSLHFLISSFKQTSVTFGHCDRNKTTYVKFVYLMSFNHFQLASQSAVFLNRQGKQVEY